MHLRHKFVLTAVIFIILLPGCRSVPAETTEPAAEIIPSATPAPPTATPDPTRSEVIDSAFSVEIEGQSQQIGLATEDEDANLSSLEVHTWNLGEAVLVRVEDPQGRFAPLTEFFSADVFDDGALEIWLTEIEENEGRIDHLTLPEMDLSGLEYIENKSTQAFMEDLKESLAENDFFTVLIQLNVEGTVPSQVDVFSLPFNNGYLLLVSEQVSFLQWLLGARPALAMEDFGAWNFLRHEGQKKMMEWGAENRPTDYRVPVYITSASIEGIRWNFRSLTNQVGYELVGLECNNRALAEIKIELGSEEEDSYWITDEDLRKGYAVASKPAIGMPWFTVRWEATLGTIEWFVVEERNLTVWYCESVVEDVDLSAPAGECEGDNCKDLTIENPSGVDGSITLVGPQLYQIDIPAGTSTYSLESGTYNFALAMCGGDWISNGTLDPSHRWLIGMPDSCDW